MKFGVVVQLAKAREPERGPGPALLARIGACGRATNRRPPRDSADEPEQRRDQHDARHVVKGVIEVERVVGVHYQLATPGSDRIGLCHHGVGIAHGGPVGSGRGKVERLECLRQGPSYIPGWRLRPSLRLCPVRAVRAGRSSLNMARRRTRSQALFAGVN